MARGFRLVPPARNLEDFRHVNGGGGLEIWYVANGAMTGNFSTGAPTANVLRAMPFVAPARGGTLDRLGYNITTNVAGNTRIGLYNSTSETNIYPSSLIVDSGTIVNSAAVKTATIDVPLTPGDLYWIALVGDVAPTVRIMASSNCSSILGWDNTFGTAGNYGLQVAFAYAALPATFPASATMLTVSTTPVPALYYRFSA